MTKIPPLPEPEHKAECDGQLWPEAYTADQLRSYGQACWEAAIEAAVYWCDEVRTPKFKHGGSVYDDTELLRQRIASAIRAMKEPK